MFIVRGDFGMEGLVGLDGLPGEKVYNGTILIS